MNPRHIFVFVVLMISPPAGADEHQNHNWPQWRGTDGNGLSTDSKAPLVWNNEQGIVWKCEVPGWGNSTPAIWRDAVFLTSQGEEKLLLHRVDKNSGNVIWTREVGVGTPTLVKSYGKSEDDRRQQFFHIVHNMATPSPVTNGQVVVAHFGNGDLAVYNLEGDLQWQRNLQKEHGTYTIWWGHANSPVLFEDSVITVCMQDSLADFQEKLSPSYLVAHDLETGEEKWKTLRMTGAMLESNDSYTTPVLYRNDFGAQIIVMGGTQLDGYDPRTGRQLWSLNELGGNRTVTGPTLFGNMIYTTVGMRGRLLAVKLGAQGEVTGDSIVWDHEKGTPDTPCSVVWDNLLLFINDNGVCRCLDRRNGQTYWIERLPGEYSASPISVNGRIYLLNREGLCTVVAATSQYQKLSVNQIDDEFFASPTISNGRFYLRGKRMLYCVAGKGLSDGFAP